MVILNAFSAAPQNFLNWLYNEIASHINATNNNSIFEKSPHKRAAIITFHV
jgi:hypothetical protein